MNARAFRRGSDTERSGCPIFPSRAATDPPASVMQTLKILEKFDPVETVEVFAL
jgi:hypothetical protein